MEKKDIEELQDFFFRAASNGYASGKESEIIPMFPGAKSYFWSEQIEERFYRYADIYFKVGDGKSFGFTLISINGKLVWYMRYSGLCHQEFVGNQKVTDTLKEALLYAYHKRLFFGGRGVINFRDRNLEYCNLPKKSFLGEFFGQDMILDITPNQCPRKIFYQDYEGGLIRK